MGQKISPIIFRLFKNNNYKHFFFVPLFKGFKRKNMEYKNKIKFCLSFSNFIKNLNENLNLLFIKLNFKIINNIELKIILPYLKEENNLNIIFSNFNNILFLKVFNKDLNIFFKILKNIKNHKFLYFFAKINTFNLKFKIYKQSLFFSKFIFFSIKTYFKNKVFSLRNIFKYLFFKLFKKNKKLLKGFKICFSGRFKGIERSRSETIKKGKVALHTIFNKIDFSISKLKTNFGTIGIKIWLFKY